MAQLFANNAVTTLASGITDSDLSLTVATGDGALFPSPTGSDYFLVTLTQSVGAETSWEIVKCTARSTDTLTIVRAQESTTAAAWASGSKVSLRLTSGRVSTEVVGPASATADSLARFDGTTGKLLKDGAVIGTDVQAYDADTAKLDVAQSWTAQQTFKELKDTVYTITDGAAFEIDPANGSEQVITLGASRTPAATNFEAGQTVLLGIDDGTDYTITWTTVNPTWVVPGGTATAPTLATTGYTWIIMTKIGSTIYAAEWGQP